MVDSTEISIFGTSFFRIKKIVKSTLRRYTTTVRCTLDMLSKSMYFCIPCLKVKDQTLIRELK